MAGRPQGLLLLALPAGVLLYFALRQAPNGPYTGLVLRNDWVMAVAAGSPAAHAGLLPGDLLLPPDPRLPGLSLRESLRTLEPGRPSRMRVSSRSGTRELWLTPRRVSPQSARYNWTLALLAAGFLLLGVWVLAMRTDRLARVFFLLCWSFAVLLCPVPRLPALAWLLAHEVLYTLVSLFLPALFLHFFALFPSREGSSLRTPGGILAAYLVSGLLGLASLFLLASQLFSPRSPREGAVALQAVAALYFALALLGALLLFVLSYRGAGSQDARRRLRVALVGTVLGVAPIAGAVLLRNLTPHLSLPGDRWAPVALVLIPASFAYAIAVHHIFDFRLVLRFSVTYLSLASLLGAAYLAGRALLRALLPDFEMAHTAMGVAILAAVSMLAGPARPWVRRLSERLVPTEEEAPVAALLDRFRPPAPGRTEEVLDSAARALHEALRLSGCGALAFAEEGPRWVSWRGEERAPAAGLSPAFQSFLAARGQVVAVDEADAGEISHADRAALAEVGATLLVPLAAAERTQAALVLGPRLSGRWFSRRERMALQAFARQTSVALENSLLHVAARERGALERELVTARRIQSHLLPRRAPVFPTLDCAAVTHSSEEVGGDYHDFVERGDREFMLAVGDGAGKGVPAALLMAAVQASFRREAALGASPAQVLTRINRQLFGHDQPEHFVCLLCACCEVRPARLIYASAGLPPPQLRRANGEWLSLEEGGLLLGVRGGSFYEEGWLALGAGDILVCATDGVTEARCRDELFGTQRLRRVVDAHAQLRAARLCDALVREVAAFAGTESPDDLTVLVLKQLTPPAEPFVSDGGSAS